MLFAVTGRTAAELIVKRADAAEPQHGPDQLEKRLWHRGRDVPTAKNYLEADEIDELNRIVTAVPRLCRRPVAPARAEDEHG